MTSTTDDPKQAGERVLQIAREVGAREAVDAEDGAALIEFTAPQLAAFESRIRADEREECAKESGTLFVKTDDANYAAIGRRK